MTKYANKRRCCTQIRLKIHFQISSAYHFDHQLVNTRKDPLVPSRLLVAT